MILLICPSPRTLDLLLEEDTPYMQGKFTATGCGNLIILGSARAGKTSIAWWLLDFVIENTNRHIALIGMSDLVLKQLPPSWKGRVSNPSFENVLDVPKGAVILMDDSAVLLNNRSGMKKAQVAWNRLYGIFSHLGQTLIFTTQNLNTIDIGVYRSTHLNILIRYCEKFPLINDPNQFSGRILEIQDILKENAELPYYRDLYYSMFDDLLCKADYPDWVNRHIEGNEERGMILSKPYGYLDKEELHKRIFGENKK